MNLMSKEGSLLVRENSLGLIKALTYVGAFIS